MSTPEKLYKPINGPEAIDLILNEFYNQLVTSGMFPLHRVWHEFEFQGGVRVKGWSTKTEEVKFTLKAGEPNADAELVEGRVDVSLAPAPPDLQRERLPVFICSKCGRSFGSKTGHDVHFKRWCKGEANNELDPLAEIIKSGFEDMTPRPEVNRHITEEPKASE